MTIIKILIMATITISAICAREWNLQIIARPNCETVREGGRKRRLIGAVVCGDDDQALSGAYNEGNEC